MKITFLGTGAADWPLQKPEDYTEFRRLSSTLIDETLLIDPGPQVMEALESLGKDPQHIKYIINTHSHPDHFSADTVAKLESMGAVFVYFDEGEEKELGGYTVRAYRGNHSTARKIMHYIISDGEKSIFYGLDGAWLMYDEVKGIKEHKPDFAVLDGTIGYRDGDYRIFEHNNLNMVLEMKKTLNPYIKQFCISHMARTLHTDHQTLSDDMAKQDVIVAYDGLELEI